METSVFTSLLILYSNHRSYCYLNYFEKFRALVNWLEPVPPDIIVPPIPWYSGSYEIQELAKHLRTSQDIVYHVLKELDYEKRLGDGDWRRVERTTR